MTYQPGDRVWVRFLVGKRRTTLRKYRGVVLTTADSRGAYEVITEAPGQALWLASADRLEQRQEARESE